MKKKLLLLTVLFLIMGITSHAQIVTNGDFETGDLTGWENHAENGLVQSADDIDNPDQIIDGTYSYFKNWGAGDMVSQVVELEPGKEYTLSYEGFIAWDWIYIYARVTDTSNDQQIAETDIHRIDTLVTSVDFMAPESGSVEIRFNKWADSPGRAGIDNIVIEEKTAPSLIENGDFETGDFTGWDVHGDNVLVQSADDMGNPDHLIDGVYSCYKNWGEGDIVSQVVEVEPGQEYNLSFKGFLAWNWIYVHARVTDTADDALVAETSIHKTDSVDASLDFVAPESGSIEIRFSKTADDPGRVGIDNITLVEKTSTEEEFARVQIIHNSADALVDVVDIFVNDEIFLEDVAFRQATPFMDVPAGVDLDFVVTPADAGIESGVGPVTVNFTADGTYVVVAAGNVSDTGYDPVEPFGLYAFDAGQEQAAAAENTDVLVFHGSTDAPTVSVWETAVVDGEIIGDFAFGDFAGYLELATNDYILEVRDAAGENTVAAYQAPLSTLELDGAAIVVVASGFLTPENNSDGEAFGLYVALPAGGDLVELPLNDDTNVADTDQMNLKVYPNPSNGVFNIQANERIAEVQVIDILGQVVYSAPVNAQNHVIDIDDMRSGIYFVQINTQAGKIIEKIQVR